MPAKTRASSALVAPVRRKRRPTRPKIDFSDIPESSDAQLRSMKRVGRPPIGTTARQLIAIRIDPGVIYELRQEADRRKIGYQTLVNQVLADFVRKRAS